VDEQEVEEQDEEQDEEQHEEQHEERLAAHHLPLGTWFKLLKFSLSSTLMLTYLSTRKPDNCIINKLFLKKRRCDAVTVRKKDAVAVRKNDAHRARDVLRGANIQSVTRNVAKIHPTILILSHPSLSHLSLSHLSHLSLNHPNPIRSRSEQAGS